MEGYMTLKGDDEIARVKSDARYRRVWLITIVVTIILCGICVIAYFVLHSSLSPSSIAPTKP